MRKMAQQSQILEALESRARQLGDGAVRLETGIAQPEAIGLYRSAGYGEIAGFGDCTGNSYSVCFEKRLSAHLLIRKADGRDARQVADVMNSVIAEGMYTVFDTRFSEEQEREFIASLSSRSALHVAEAGGEIGGVQSIDLLFTGFASAQHVATMGTWLRSDFRGRGVGRALAAESFVFARSHGYRKIVIQVLAGNDRALRFYRSLGFSGIGVAREHVRLGNTFHR